jgi:6-pyruvoyl tetrahydropterin synthase/QueD family protein
MLTVCRTFNFSYAHRLPDYEGNCNRYHGHNGSCEVEVAGKQINGYPTMIVDFRVLKQAVMMVIDELDHRDLTDFFSGVDDRGNTTKFPATAEVICSYLAKKIPYYLPEGVVLVRVKVTETPDCWAEWKDYTNDSLKQEITKQLKDACRCGGILNTRKTIGGNE